MSTNNKGRKKKQQQGEQPLLILQQPKPAADSEYWTEHAKNLEKLKEPRPINALRTMVSSRFMSALRHQDDRVTTWEEKATLDLIHRLPKNKVRNPEFNTNLAPEKEVIVENE